MKERIRATVILTAYSELTSREARRLHTLMEHYTCPEMTKLKVLNEELKHQYDNIRVTAQYIYELCTTKECASKDEGSRRDSMRENRLMLQRLILGVEMLESIKSKLEFQDAIEKATTKR